MMESRLELLHEMGYRIESKEPPVRLKLREIMKNKRMTASKLVKETGLSRQTLNVIMKGEQNPRIDVALKLAEVLQVSVEDIFALNDSAWETMVLQDGRALFWDLAGLQLIEGPVVKQIEEATGIEHWDTENETLISEEEFLRIWDEELKNHLDEEIEKAREAQVSRRDEKIFQKMARDTIEKRLREKYPTRFQRVVQTIRHA
ncbi:helix-turn-helix transcriptional regulator [Exiguobacterium sp. s140]|uniref:helix-turn-helix transcriptional regulator n=1 Tax=Exiguobacterium sp. s140 TaxID=2751290 RepID=UPI0020356487|nr:helix-turn-helix transcriptional regulator [Exiguobacterium sp. s140]